MPTPAESPAPAQPLVAAEPIVEATPVNPPAAAPVVSAIPIADSAPAKVATPQTILPAIAVASAVVSPPPTDKRVTAPEASQIVSRTELDAAFVGSIKKVPLSIGYKLSLVLVAFFMVLLPLVYIALIVLVAYGAVQYAQSGTALF